MKGILFEVFKVTMFNKSHDVILKDHMNAKETCTMQIP